MGGHLSLKAVDASSSILRAQHQVRFARDEPRSRCVSRSKSAYENTWPIRTRDCAGCARQHEGTTLCRCTSVGSPRWESSRTAHCRMETRGRSRPAASAHRSVLATDGAVPRRTTISPVGCVDSAAAGQCEHVRELRGKGEHRIRAADHLPVRGAWLGSPRRGARSEPRMTNDDAGLRGPWSRSGLVDAEREVDTVSTMKEPKRTKLRDAGK